MSDPTTTPVQFSWAALPTQLFGAVPAWLWRYAGGTVLIFGLAFSGDYYLGQPVTSWIRAVAAQKAKAVAETRAVLPQTDPDTTAKIDALVTAIDKISSMQTSMALKDREFKALASTLEYTIGRVSTLEAAMAEKPATSPAPKAKETGPRKAKPAPISPVTDTPLVETKPMVQIGGAP